MKIELRSVEYFATGSHETACYAARLYVDGQYTANVSNQGYGGPDEIHHRKDMAPLLKRAEAWARKLPPQEIYGYTLESNLELVIGDLFEKWLARGDLVKALRRKVLVKESATGKIMETSWKGLRKLTPQHIASVKATHGPDDIILNTLPLDEALTLYMESHPHA